MNPIIFMMFVLPAFLVKEGYKMFKKWMGRDDRWTKFLYAVLLILIIWLIILLIKNI